MQTKQKTSNFKKESYFWLTWDRSEMWKRRHPLRRRSQICTHISN